MKKKSKKIIEYGIKKKKIKYHAVTSRIKTLESLNNKIEEKQIKKPFFEVQDIIGIRIVCLFLSQIPEIENLLQDCFKIISKDNKIDDCDDSTFGYMSVHYIAKIKTKFKGTHYEKILNIPFEIQIRTISMDTWASISHHLDYKTPEAVPSNLKREFNALSALLYIADTNFERFYKERQKSKEQINKSIKKDKFDMEQEINLDTLSAYLLKNFPKRQQPRDFTNLSRLVSELEEAGYRSLNEINDIINKNYTKLTKYERDEPSKKHSAIGVIRRIFRWVDSNFDKIVKKNNQLLHE